MLQKRAVPVRHFFFSEGDVLPVGLSVALCQAEVYRVEVAALAAVADE